MSKHHSGWVGHDIEEEEDDDYYPEKDGDAVEDSFDNEVEHKLFYNHLPNADDFFILINDFIEIHAGVELFSVNR